MAVDSRWLGSSNLVGYGVLGSTNQPTIPSFNSSLLPPLGIPSSDLTLPNLGLTFNFNSEFVPSVSDLNPSYLQLHGDDVCFTLENSLQDGVQH